MTGSSSFGWSFESSRGHLTNQSLFTVAKLRRFRRLRQVWLWPTIFTALGTTGQPQSLWFRLLLATSAISALSELKSAAEPGDIPLGRGAEMLLVFATEVCRVFVSHSQSGTRSVQIVAEH